MKELSRKYLFDINNSLWNDSEKLLNYNITECLESINDNYKENDQDLVDSLKLIIGKSGSQFFDEDIRLQFILLLTVYF